MITMESSAFLGLIALIAGLTFYFTSGTFTLINAPLGGIFQILGVILIYVSVALVMWGVLSSINIFLERIGRRI